MTTDGFYPSPIVNSIFLPVGAQLTAALAASSYSSTGSITATAGGTAGSSVPLTTIINTVTTVGTNGDGVALPVATPKVIYVINNASNGMIVFGNGTDTINGIAGNVGIAQGGNTTVGYVCNYPGVWTTITGSAGQGNVYAPASTTTGIVAVWDSPYGSGNLGPTLKNTPVGIDNSGNITGVGNITSGTTVFGLPNLGSTTVNVQSYASIGEVTVTGGAGTITDGLIDPTKSFLTYALKTKGGAILGGLYTTDVGSGSATVAGGAADNSVYSYTNQYLS